MTGKPSRSVTRCVTCQTKFKPARSDSKYCSAKCRQQAHRSREKLDDLDREIEKTRLRYWGLIAEKARAQGVDPSRVVTDEAQLVNVDGTVWMGGKPVGHVKPDRPGWATWGLEAAGAPYAPPPPGPEQLHLPADE